MDDATCGYMWSIGHLLMLPRSNEGWMHPRYPSRSKQSDFSGFRRWLLSHPPGPGPVRSAEEQQFGRTVEAVRFNGWVLRPKTCSGHRCVRFSPYVMSADVATEREVDH